MSEELKPKHGELFNSKNAKSPIDEIEHLAAMFVNGTLYRRIEVTERELFIDELENLANKFAEWKGLQRVDDLDRDFFGYLFDSGKFKLVNGKG